MPKGLKFVPKVREPKAREINLSSTSKARQELEYARKHGTPEDFDALSGKVSEKYPDMLQDRRVIS